ncbi:MAG TPA: prepilin-type N-terminal cleavage/methylation domain-containing protein [Chthoniobacterales bacterium]|jgi:prepilin-type N-terminal cleavage/methylation domain-containing protein|nr:prepilin-type N-terminal cleavage/methylation domain-containing protein [Chthoniobacterales bacterium]
MHYIKLSNYRRFGFTLVEIMIVAAVIALLAAICVPGFLRARKRTQATRVLEDLRLIDHAIDQYAVETNKSAGMSPTFTDLKVYVKANARLYNTGRDIFNRRYGPFTVDSFPQVPRRTFIALSDVADTDFWSPYN